MNRTSKVIYLLENKVAFHHVFAHNDNHEK